MFEKDLVDGQGIWDLRFTIWDLGFGIWDLRFTIYDLGVVGIGRFFKVLMLATIIERISFVSVFNGSNFSDLKILVSSINSSQNRVSSASSSTIFNLFTKSLVDLALQDAR